MKSCENCHYGKITSFDMSPCFEAGGGCFNDKNKPNWTPLTNGDKVREAQQRKPNGSKKSVHSALTGRARTAHMAHAIISAMKAIRDHAPAPGA